MVTILHPNSIVRWGLCVLGLWEVVWPLLALLPSLFQRSQALD